MMEADECGAFCSEGGFVFLLCLVSRGSDVLVREETQSYDYVVKLQTGLTTTVLHNNNNNDDHACPLPVSLISVSFSFLPAREPLHVHSPHPLAVAPSPHSNNQSL